MRINADILYENLSEIMDVQRFGQSDQALSLMLAEFYSQDSYLKKHCVYLADVGTFEQIQHCEDQITYICVGGKPPRAYCRGTCVVLFMEDEKNVLAVFNAVQAIFSKYQLWEDALNTIVEQSADITELINLSVPIFGNPISVVDQNLCFLANTECQAENGTITEYKVTNQSPVAIETMISVKKAHLKERKIRELYFHDGRRFLCINFYLHELYRGNMSMQFSVRTYRNSDGPLFLYLANFVQKALSRHVNSFNKQAKMLKSVINEIMQSENVQRDRMKFTVNSNSDKPNRYICVVVFLSSDVNDIPHNYLCELMESTIPGGVATMVETSIAFFMNAANSPYPYEKCFLLLEQFLKDLNLKAGKSNFFSDISEARMYHAQSKLAYEYGLTRDPEKTIYCFTDYALTYMVSHSTGDLTVESLLPEGLLALKQLDENSSINFWESLRLYLDYNMSATKAANSLFIHRSTFLQRLDRIIGILDMDLNDPRQRMYIQYCINLIDAQLLN